MAEKNKVRIKIFGTEYLLKGDSDPSYMQELADLVDQRMRTLGEPGTVQVNRIAILTAFQFADELMKARRALDSERQGSDQAARKIAELDLKIQKALRAPDPGPGDDGGLVMEEAFDEPDPEHESKDPSADEGEFDSDNDDLNWK